MQAIGGIKIFRVGEDEWYAAASAEDALQCMADNCTGGDVDEARREFMEGGDPIELTDDQVAEYQYEDTDEADEALARRTFREELDLLVENDARFPRHFASGNL